MSNNLKFDNKVVYNKLDEYFHNNIKVTLKILTTIFIITKDDKFYNININDENIPSFIFDKDSQFLKTKIVDNLCNKEIIDLSFCCHHYQHFDFIFNFIARTKNKIYFFDNNKLELKEIINDLKINDIKCGALHTLVLTENNDVYAWGINEYGQLGNNSNEEQLTPIKLQCFDKEKVVMISCGWNHSLALTEMGHVYSWGQNKFGQLGVGTISDSNFPNLIDLKGIEIINIKCGKWHNLLLSKEGIIYAFGDNEFGQIGNKDYRPHTKPTRLSHEKTFVDIASHPDKNISASISDDDIYYVWGECKSEKISSPLATNFGSFNEVFTLYASIQYKSSKKLIEFDDSLFRFGHYKESYDEIKEIGDGSFGKVYRVADKKGKHYAIKKIFNVINFEKEFMSHNIASSFECEFLMNQFDAWFENIGGKQLLYIKMELCERTLQQIIDEIKIHFNSDNNISLSPVGYFIASQLFIEILNGVLYLHQNKMLHRDLKPMNILLKESQNTSNFVKIADFGYLVEHQFETQSHTNDKGTPKYMAPEVINSTRYGPKADIFSLGKIFEELIKLDIFTAYEENLREPTLMERYRESLDLYNKMTSQIPARRPNCEEILAGTEQWAFDKNDPEVKKELRTIMKRKFYVFSILESKLK